MINQIDLHTDNSDNGNPTKKKSDCALIRK